MLIFSTVISFQTVILLLLSPVLGRAQTAGPMEEANSLSAAIEAGPGGVISQQSMGTLPSRRTLRIVSARDVNRIFPYLSTYIQDPSAALYVEELIIDAETWPRPSRFSKHDPPPPSEEESAIHNSIKEYLRTIGLSPDVTQQMIDAFTWKVTPGIDSDHHGFVNDRGYAAAATVIFLSLCKNLTHLQVYGVEYAYFIRDFLLANNYGTLPSPALQHLREVRIESYTPQDSRSYDRAEFLEHFRYFGRLPAIESYTANACLEYQINLDLTPPGTSNIRKISITNSDVGSQVLGSIIRVPRALEEFTFTAGGLAHFKGGSPVLLPKTLGKCLLEHKDTLRVIDMDIHNTLFGVLPDEEDVRDPYMEEDWDDENPDYRIDKYWRLDEASGNGKSAWSEDLEDTRAYGYTMGSLHDFVALESLSLPITALLGPPRPPREGHYYYPRKENTPPFRLVDALPPNLKSLRLYDYQRGADALWDEYVHELKEKMADKFPLLAVLEGVDEPCVANSQYGEEAGYDEIDPPPEVLKRNARWKEQYMTTEQ